MCSANGIVQRLNVHSGSALNFNMIILFESETSRPHKPEQSLTDTNRLIIAIKLFYRKVIGFR